MRILIKVTKDILEKSKNCSKLQATRSCAIAESIREIFPYASVETDTIYFLFYKPGVDIIISINSKIALPNEATQFIAAFDSKEPESRAKMQPISFEIDVPNELIAQIGIGEVYGILSTSRTLELVSI